MIVTFKKNNRVITYCFSITTLKVIGMDNLESHVGKILAITHYLN